jgi:catechol 2,3-dioxygenase-like lactoylglutathione lyase family enzyme
MATVLEQQTNIPALTFIGLIHEGVPCSRKNLEACVKFYIDVLGMKMLPRPKALDDMGVPGAWLGDENNTVQFHLIAKDEEYRPGADAPASPTGRHTAWMVKDLDAFRARMRALGVHFDEIGGLIGGAQLFIKDPEGHTWEFQEPRR